MSDGPPLSELLMRIRPLSVAALAALVITALTSAPIALAAQEHGAAHNPAEHHPVTVVVIVRHAEKAAAPANDPPLTSVGTDRAKALVEALKDAPVGAVLHTPTTRTRDTARPVAAHFGLTPEVLSMGPMTTHAERVAEAVMKHAGKTVVVVGHSNTIMDYVAALGGPKREALCDYQYDGLYTVVIAHGKAQLVHGQYGPPNPEPAVACGAMMTPATRP